MTRLHLRERLQRFRAVELSEAEQGGFRLAAGLILILEAGMALALVLGPSGAVRLLGGDPASAGGARIAGLLALTLVALLWTGRADAGRARHLNLIGAAGRLLLAAALALAGGRLLPIGLFEALAALILADFYYRPLAALTERPAS
ncbi:MAG: hypothetical protein ACJ8ER_12500 [Allosphingosinicella sp.]